MSNDAILYTQLQEGISMAGKLNGLHYLQNFAPLCKEMIWQGSYMDDTVCKISTKQNWYGRKITWITYTSARFRFHLQEGQIDV